MSEQRWLTAQEAATRLRVHVDTVYLRIRERKLTTRREGRKILVEAASLESYERMTTTPALYALPSSEAPARQPARPASSDMPWLGAVTAHSRRRTTRPGARS